MADDYQGLFLRHYLGQTPDQNDLTEGWTDTPDIIFNGTVPARDPSVFAKQANYDQEPASTVTLNVDNYVYVRGLNTTNGPLDARLWFYYAAADVALWPQQWRSDNIWLTDPQNPQNWVELPAVAAGAIGVGAPVFMWRPTDLEGGQHFCVVAFAENPPLSNPPRSPAPTSGMDSWDDLGAYVQSHPNMAWRNTVDVTGYPVTWQRTQTVTGARKGGQFSIGIQCTNMPTDGFFAFSVPGYDQRSSIVFPAPPNQRVPIYDPNQSQMVKVAWRAGFSSSITITYWQGATTPPAGANIAPVIGINSERLVGRVANPHRYARRMRVFESTELDARFDIETIQIVGSLPYQWFG